MKTVIDPVTTASWSKSYREAEGMTQRQLATKLATTPGVIGDLERGLIRSRRVARELLDLTPSNLDDVI